MSGLGVLRQMLKNKSGNKARGRPAIGRAFSRRRGPMESPVNQTLPIVMVRFLRGEISAVPPMAGILLDRRSSVSEISTRRLS